MKILIACEFSGVIREAFKKRGHDVWSCDILPTEIPGQHYECRVEEIINQKWDMMIAHPPCTFLAVSGARWFKERTKEQEDALSFVSFLMNQKHIDKICIENPVSVISSRIKKPDQIIQPWMFGNDESKKTCLWLKGLPLLHPTKIVNPDRYRCKCGEVFGYSLGKYGCWYCQGSQEVFPLYKNQTPSGQNNKGPSVDRQKERSRTYQGIADAMAQQWG